MRVLHLPIVICNQPWEMSRSLRRIGIESDYMVVDDNDAQWLMRTKPDFNLNIYHRFDRKWAKQINRDKTFFFLYALLKYDVFHYHSNFPLFDDFWDMKILKAFGKKIVVSSWGCDIRSKQKNSSYEFNTCATCKVFCDDRKKQHLLNQVHKYADLEMVHMPELLEYNQYSRYLLPGFIDTSFWKREKIIKPQETFKIFHASGNSEIRGDVRGTEFLSKAVNRLKKEGFKIEFLFFDKVPNKELKRKYEEADLVVEQLRYGTYGLTAAEGMAMSKPVMAYIRPFYKKFYPDLPIINANPKTIYTELKWALTHREQLTQIGHESRKFVEDYHDSLKLAKKLYQIYQSLY